MHEQLPLLENWQFGVPFGGFLQNMGAEGPAVMQ